MLESVCVVENTLGNKTAWNSWSLWVKFTSSLSIFTPSVLLMIPQVSDSDDWVAVTKLFWFTILTIELSAVSRFDISSVVLVEVVKLIIHIYWSLNLGLDFWKLNCT